MISKIPYATVHIKKLGIYSLFLLLIFFIYISPPKVSATANATLGLSPNYGTIAVDNSFVLALNLNSGGNSVNAWQASLTYSTSSISSVSVSIPASSPFQLNPSTDITFGGAINISRFNLSASTYSGPIAYITLTAKTVGNGTVGFTYICTPSDLTPCSSVAGAGENFLVATSGANYTVNAANVCGNLEQTLPYVLSYYNPRSYDHYYTAYRCETYTLVQKLGYRLDGPEFNTSDPNSVPGAVPVWRLYNPKTYQHLWTISQADINNAISNAGYKLEGIAFYTAPSNAPGVRIVWRLYNPKTYQHLWTPSQASITFATQKLGFYVEGVAFYSQ